MAEPAVFLPAAKRRLLDELAEGLDAQALAWVSGYAAGLAARGVAALRNDVAAPASATDSAPAFTVLYGSQTGNARRWAERMASESRDAGFAVTLANVDDYKPCDLAKLRNVVFAISTQGDGEPPEDALDFMEFLLGKRAPRLENLRYAVLALGDSSYPEFCAAGRRLDERLQTLGAQRFAERADCDLDIEALAAPWWKQTLEKLRDRAPAMEPATHVANVTPLRRSPVHDREHPFAASVLVNQRITGRESAKDVRHLELSLAGSGIKYRPGDSIGVWQRNPPAAVDATLHALGEDGDRVVAHNGEEYPLRHWLSAKREITRLAKPLLAAHAKRSGNAELHRLLGADGRRELPRFLDTHQPIDLLRQWPAGWSASDWIGALPPLTPRLYSVASSPVVSDEEVHITVARVAYERFGALHIGAASEYLCASAEESRVAVYVEENPRFRVPADGSRDIVMIGAGTGVAPFRAFVQERERTGARGRNWLFFGAQHFHSQFLYQSEWQRALKKGQLHRLDPAFSRDQEKRLYVQHRLVEYGHEVFAWIEGGAHCYVCGAIAMEKDVRSALCTVAAEQLGSEERGAEWFSELRRAGRYSRDVY